MTGQARHELEVATLAGHRVVLIGEAKATIGPVGPAQLDRLDRIAGVLTAQTRDATGAARALFSLMGSAMTSYARAGTR